MAAPLWAGRFIDAPYVEGASSYDGLDCWGLLERVYADVRGMPLPPYPGPRHWRQRGLNIAEAAEAYARQFIEVIPGQEVEFDAVLIGIGGRATHVGVVTSPGWMLHADAGSNVTHERYRPSLLWSKRIAGFYRYVVQPDAGGREWPTERVS
jgi:cell wall-associated NlpC family hydrolase